MLKLVHLSFALSEPINWKERMCIWVGDNDECGNVNEYVMQRKLTMSNKTYLVMLSLTAHRVVVVLPELNCKSFSMNQGHHHCNVGEDSHVFILLRFCFRILQLVHSWLAHIGAGESIEDVRWWRKRQQNGKKISDHSQYCPGQEEQRLRKWVAAEKMHCWNN